jgi:hypothetical protein
MPFLEDDNALNLAARHGAPKGFAVTPGASDLEDKGDKPAWNWGAAFRRNNETAAMASSESMWTGNEPEAGFNPWEKVKGTSDEVNFRALSEARNQTKFNAIKADIARENEDRKLLDSQPWWMGLITEGTAGILSPTSLIPGGTFVKGAKGGMAIAKAAGSVGAANAISAGVQEAALHNIEQTRTAGESATAIGASLFLGGVLGAGGQALLSKMEWQKGVAALENDLATPGSRKLPMPDTFNTPRLPTDLEMQAHGRVESVSLDKVFGTESTRQWERFNAGDHPGELVKGYADKPVAAKLSNGEFILFDGHHRTELALNRGDTALDMHVIDASKYAPGADKKPSKSSGMSDDELLQELMGGGGSLKSVGAAANTATELGDNTIAGAAARGVAASTAKLNPLLRALHSPSAAYREIATDLVENPLYLKKNFDGVASQPAVETLMKEYNGGLTKALQATNDAYPEFVKAGGALGKDEFREAVGRAMRRGDTDADPIIAKVAQEYRAKVFDPLKKQAIDAGLLPKDVSVDTAQSYFTRMWNGRKISADEQGFKGMVQDWVAQKSPEWAEQFDKSAERRLNPVHQEISSLEMEKVRRAEELKRRGDEADTSEMSEGDIRQALRVVNGGAPKPKGVDTLSQFVLKQGGLVDDAGELAHRGITNKARPGLIRKERKTAQSDKGGWTLDDMARHAWENGYFPEHSQRPSIDAFVEALNDDFHKIRAVLKHGDEDAFKLNELVAQLEADLARAGVGTDGKAPRFSTSEEMKGAVERVYKALDAEADRKLAILKDKLNERQADIRVDRESRFVGDPKELGRQIADEVFDTLTGRTGSGVRPEHITIKARGPLKERTFNIEDLFRSSNGRAVEDYLEHDVEQVARRYTRVMGADVELARKFGSVDMVDQITKIRDDYRNLRAGITDEKHLTALAKREKDDISDLEAVRDMLRGTNPGSPAETNYSRIVRAVNHLNYLRSMGEVAIASLTETVRPAMVHGLMPYMETLGQTLTNLKGVKASVAEAQLAGVVTERVLGTRLATLSEIIDPYASRGPVEAFLENMTNIASRWNGIRLLTDMQKSIAAVMTQNRLLQGASSYAELAPKEKAYLAYLGIDQSMAERIGRQFADHGETIDKVHVANQEKWTDEVAARTYRAAISKDVDSIITTKGVADTPLFANTPTGRAMLQFKSFALASHQRVLLRGLQEDQARFVGGLIAMTTIGIMATYLKAISGNRTEKLQDIGKNPGWWISEGLDKAGIFAIPMELSNTFEKATGLNPIKTPIKAFDDGSAISQKNQNRSLLGSVVGPTGGLIDDATQVMGLPKKMIDGEEVAQGQKNAAERLLPFNSYVGMRQFLRYVANPPQ